MKSHHTPQGFRNNYIGSVTKSLGDILRWQLDRIRNHLPPAARVPTPQTTADLDFIQRNAVSGAEMSPAVTWIGHATMLVQASGLNVLTDPVFSTRVSPVRFAGPSRAQAPGILLQDLPHIDVVAISHNHYDHLDRASVRTLARQPGGAPLFLVPLGLKSWLERLGIRRAVELDWWDGYMHAGVEFQLTPAQHWSGRSLNDRNKTLWGAWAVLGADFHWFFTGDTGYSEDFRDARKRFAARHTDELGGGFDIALIAVGACLPRWFMKDQHVDLEEAVQIHLDLGAKRSVGVHWGTFALADDPLDQPIHDLAGARRSKGVSEQAFFLLPIGGTRQLPRRVGHTAVIESEVGKSQRHWWPSGTTFTSSPTAQPPGRAGRWLIERLKECPSRRGSTV
jgi:N-acyl-phosphatidylethanolamine-hydrolysing phospholipase D